jgi:hypothetical protein
MALRAAEEVAQTALTTLLVFCGLLLIVFSEPPARQESAGGTLRRDWRSVVLALALGLAFAAILAVPPLSAFFDLVPLGLADDLFLGAVALGWAAALRWVWQARILERILNLDTERMSLT